MVCCSCADLFHCVTIRIVPLCVLFFFFNDTATTEIYTLALHDALPISARPRPCDRRDFGANDIEPDRPRQTDRKSTRLNSSHTDISYAVFCLKKENHTSELHSHCYLRCRLLLVNVLHSVPHARVVRKTTPRFTATLPPSSSLFRFF